MKILAAYRSDAGGFYRLAAPLSVLRYRYPDDEFNIETPTTESVHEYDLLWLHQQADSVAEIIARDFKEAGKPVVYDVDDWIFGWPASWPGYDDYFKRGAAVGTDRLFYHERLLKLADVVTCPTRMLAEKLKQHCGLRDVRTLPNCVVQGDWDTLAPKEHNLDGPVVGWFGTGTHWDDWAEVADAVDEALEEVNGHLAIIGAPEVVSMFPNRLARRTRIQPLVPARNLKGVRELVKAFDVGLAWCTHRLTASLCRSPLKAIQYGAAGIPVLASETVYGELPGWEHGISNEDCSLWPAGVIATPFGVLVREPKDIAKAIVAMLKNKDPVQTRAQGWQARVWCSHSYEWQAERWRKVMLELLEPENATEPN